MGCRGEINIFKLKKRKGIRALAAINREMKNQHVIYAPKRALLYRFTGTAWRLTNSDSAVADQVSYATREIPFFQKSRPQAPLPLIGAYGQYACLLSL
jgi:hypothetical protein